MSVVLCSWYFKLVTICQYFFILLCVFLIFCIILLQISFTCKKGKLRKINFLRTYNIKITEKMEENYIFKIGATLLLVATDSTTLVVKL